MNFMAIQQQMHLPSAGSRALEPPPLFSHRPAARSPQTQQKFTFPHPNSPFLLLYFFPPGEKLDYKACEALEEIFKRLQFRIVDLEQTSLDEDVSGSRGDPREPRGFCGQFCTWWGSG